MWQMTNKSTEQIIEYTPPVTTRGEPEKFEFRGVYLRRLAGRAMEGDLYDNAWLMPGVER